MNDPNDHPIEESYEPLAAREFRFDSARGRYMMLELATNGSDHSDFWTAAGPMKWTDYEGDIPYGDFEVETSSPFATTATVNYFALAGHQTLDPNEQPAETAYWHEDLIGSTALTTDESGSVGVPPAELAYSAFGELLTASGAPGGPAPSGAPRYQYAGAWGYESGLLSLQGANADLPPITLQHLGHRWYQPDSGRFVQRDPIGILGGVNVYAYCVNSPSACTDPTGLLSELFTPAGLSAFIEAELLLGRTVSVVVNGKLVTVVSTAVMPVAGGGRSTLVLKTLTGCVQYTFDKVRLEKIQTSAGWVLQPASSGVCGATGLEAAPFILFYGVMCALRRRRIAYGQRSSTDGLRTGR
jgi:RHS repeat-associated protein